MRVLVAEDEPRIAGDVAAALKAAGFVPEIVRDGEVVASVGDGSARGVATRRVEVGEAGWIAARAWGRRRNSYGHALWAHTSPVYLRERPTGAVAGAAAAFFVERIARAREWIATRARFDDLAQRERMLRLFDEGRAYYARLSS